MAKSKAPVVLFLGAGASADIGFPTSKQFVENIGLDPYNQNLLNSNFGNRANLLNAAYKHIQIKDIEGVYNFLRAYENIPQIQLMSDRFKETQNRDGSNSLRRYLNDISSLERTLNQILHRSYDYVPQAHEKKAVEIYAPLFEFLLKSNIFGDLHELAIYTTNYDVVIEEMFKLSFIRDNYDVIDGFGREEKSDAMIYDDLEFNRSGKNERPIIKLYKLHGSMNWAIRKNDNVLVKNIASAFVHDNYTSPIIAYPGDHNIKPRDEFKKLNAHFEQDLRQAERCIVIGFSFRDWDGINQLFKQVMGKYNKKLFVEISGLRPKLRGNTVDLFSNFTGRYEYHSGGIKKLEQKLRKKYQNISRREEEMKRV